MPRPVPQAAVLAVHAGRVCLVTSSSGRRWVIPKGQIDPGHTPEEAAAIEAWEEAGLRGTLDPAPLGTFDYTKYDRDYRVTVYRLTVTQVAEEWPERRVRRRLFLSAAEAADRVDEPGLKELIRRALGPAPAGQTAVA